MLFQNFSRISHNIFIGLHIRDLEFFERVCNMEIDILDSGMSVSFQSGSAGSAGTVSQESSPQQNLMMLSSRAHHQMTGASRVRKLSANLSTNL